MFQVNVQSAELLSPKSVVPLKNWTLVREWPLAVTAAARLIEAGAVKVAPGAGEVKAMTGGGLMLTTKLVVAHKDWSQTVKAIVVVPTWPGAGVNVTVRFVPVPPRRILVLGRRVGLEETAVTVRFVAGISASPTVKDSGDSVVPAFPIWSGILEMIGGVLALGV